MNTPIRSLCVLACLLVGCAEYDPPPDGRLTLPETGVFQVGDPLVVAFTEPVTRESVKIAVWPSGPNDKLEGEFAPGLKPKLRCSPVEGTCDDTTVTLSEDGLTLTVELKGPDFGKAKVPWVLEVGAGLTDLAGRKTGVPYLFDFQFAPSDKCSGEPVAFNDGVYLIWATIQEPVPVPLQLYADVTALEKGEFVIAAGKADNMPDADNDTSNPDELVLDETFNAFALFFGGCVTNDGDDRFVPTEAQDVYLELLGGAISLTLFDLRMTGTIVTDSETGEEGLEGTLSYSKVTLDLDTPTDYEAGNTPFYMTKLKPEQIPEGVPRVCGDLCGKVQQQCEPPADFPPDAFCSEE